MADHSASPELHWVDPPARGILPLDAFHVPRRLQRQVRAGDFCVSCDEDFSQTVSICRKLREDSWINDTLAEVYNQLFALGSAHSVEVRKEGVLLGGLYGVCLGGAFFGESMFSLARDASKIALVHLVCMLRQCGFTLLDAQFITPHLATFGAKEISREEYHVLLQEALVQPVAFSGKIPTREALQDFLSPSKTQPQTNA